jgi:hypothetical protein
MEFKNENGETLLNTMSFTDMERADFIKGWRDVGGYMGDTNSSNPRCAPWYHDNVWIKVSNEALTPQLMGAGWWEQLRKR